MAVGLGGGTADRATASPVTAACGLGIGTTHSLDSIGFSTGWLTEQQQHI